MKKDKVYFLTFTGLCIVVFSISIITVNYLFSHSKEQLLNYQLESSSREAREIAQLLEKQLSLGIPAKIVAENLQKVIENTGWQTNFICMYDTSGVEICHPDPQRVGQPLDGNSTVENVNGSSESDFLALLRQGKAGGGVRTFSGAERNSEIIYVYPVNQTGWMVAAHANAQLITRQLNNLKIIFFLAQAFSALIIVILSFVAVRWIGSKYERSIETDKEHLMQDVINLSKLNADLVQYQQKTAQETSIQTNNSKQRILTYWRDELVPVQVDNIAFFYTNQSQTQIYCKDNSIHDSTSSLDELYEQVNPSEFFRANRQFIISINALNKIYRYGNNQLKLDIVPKPPEEIIISKNKAAEFKHWLNS